jgi:hypothetical protein
MQRIISVHTLQDEGNIYIYAVKTGEWRTNVGQDKQDRNMKSTYETLSHARD